MTTHLALNTILRERLQVSATEIAAFCERWQVMEFALFGSILRDDFHPDTSDVDVLVSFSPTYTWTYDAAFEMREELIEMFQRPVDLISRQSIERSPNWLRRNNILNSAQVIYGG